MSLKPKNFKSRIQGYAEDVGGRAKISLEQYVELGMSVEERKALEGLTVPVDCRPPRARWESTYLSNYLSIVGMSHLGRFEVATLDNELDIAAVRQAFFYKYFHLLSKLYAEALYGARFNGRKLGMLGGNNIAFVAMGVPLGLDGKAFTLVRLLLLAWNRTCVILQDGLPISCFMLRVMADFLNLPAPRLAEKGIGREAFEALYNAWRSPDTELLAELLKEACQVHILHRSPSSMKRTFEFSELPFQVYPVEIVLVLNLRHRLGLRNPTVDHPLMKPLLLPLAEGELQSDAFEPDDLLVRVLERMKLDGFDEAFVIDACAQNLA